MKTRKRQEKEGVSTRIDEIQLKINTKEKETKREGA